MGPAADAISPSYLVKSIFNKVAALLLSTNHITFSAACLLGQSCVAVGSTLVDLTKLALKKEKICLHKSFSLF